MRLVALPKKTLNLLSKQGKKQLKELERATGAKIKVFDEGAQVEDEENPGMEWEAEQVLSALEAGFPLKIALNMLKDDFYLEKLDLMQAFRGKEAQVERAKARIIGTEGTAKQKIEELSGAFIAVGDETVAVIGKFEELKDAKEAVMRLLEGAPHASVFYYLEKRERERA
ncbi:hypothetical protein AUJ65_01010 [Candidatus Micrarchaeota archaeon CG1_02_51_15]|nr:MAG: hypothetical protein AUJ65_01010 [Candidatus Micrarchaeota archaeon CG1_02_51_15]